MGFRDSNEENRLTMIPRNANHDEMHAWCLDVIKDMILYTESNGLYDIKRQLELTLEYMEQRTPPLRVVK